MVVCTDTRNDGLVLNRQIISLQMHTRDRQYCNHPLFLNVRQETYGIHTINMCRFLVNRYLLDMSEFDTPQRVVLICTTKNDIVYKHNDLKHINKILIQYILF